MSKCHIVGNLMYWLNDILKVRKRANIRNRYNQTPHLTQDTNGKVTTSQLDITNESQEGTPFPAGDHMASINRHARKHNKNKKEITLLIHKRSTVLERLNPKFNFGYKLGSWYVAMPYCLGQCDLNLRPQFLKNRTHSISPILYVFYVAVQNLVCGYILGNGVSPTVSWSL